MTQILEISIVIEIYSNIYNFYYTDLFLLGLSNDVNGGMPDFVRLYTGMPVLEDGLSSGHASDTENNNPSQLGLERKIYDITGSSGKIKMNKLDSPIKPIPGMALRTETIKTVPLVNTTLISTVDNSYTSSTDNNSEDTCKTMNKIEPDVDAIYTMNIQQSTPPPPPAPVAHRNTNNEECEDLHAALRDIKSSLKQSQIFSNINAGYQETIESPKSESPVWIPRNETSHSHESIDSENPSKLLSCDEEEADTDLETDRLLGQQRLDDQGFLDEKLWCDRKSSGTTKLLKSPSNSNNMAQFSNSNIRSGNMTGLNTNDLTLTGCDGDDTENAPKSPTDSMKSQKDKHGKSKNKEGEFVCYSY